MKKTVMCVFLFITTISIAQESASEFPQDIDKKMKLKSIC